MKQSKINLLKFYIIQVISYMIYFLLLSLGFSLIIIYIYLIFLRERLPRDIPFTLTEFRFYILCFICIMYIYKLKHMIYPKKSNKIFSILLNYFYIPFSIIIKILKQKFIISTIYENTWLKIIPIIENWLFIHNAFFIYIYYLIPRIILLSIFLVDVFYLHKIEIFYYFIFIGILSLTYNLIYLYLRYVLEDSIKFLENIYTKVAIFEEGFEEADFEHNLKALHHDRRITVREYIEIQYEAFITYGDNNNFIEYYGDPFSTEIRYTTYAKTHNIKPKDMTVHDYENLNKPFHFLMPKIITLKIFLDFNTKYTQQNFYIPQIKIGIIFMYLICWFYILFVSFHTLHELKFTLYILDILSSYAQELNPFSNIIDNNENIYK